MKINYLTRIKKGLESIIILSLNKNPTKVKRITKIAESQLKNIQEFVKQINNLQIR